ncbi:hypothetical protein RI367_005722 [Sorochytrium milnesiophthora]
MPVHESSYSLRSSKERAAPYAKDKPTSPTKANYKPPVSPTKIATASGLPVHPQEHKKVLEQIRTDSHDSLRPTVRPNDPQVASHKSTINQEVTRHGQNISKDLLRHRPGGALSPTKLSTAPTTTKSPSTSSSPTKTTADAAKKPASPTKSSPTKIPVANSAASPAKAGKATATSPTKTSAPVQGLQKLQQDIKAGGKAVADTVNVASGKTPTSPTKKAAGVSK